MKVLLPLIVVIFAALIIFVGLQKKPSATVDSTPATSSAIIATSTPIAQTPEATSSPLVASTTQTASKQPEKPASKPSNQDKPVSSVAPIQIDPTPAPYSTPPQSFTSIDTATRAALVNILCMPKRGTLRPISGSGVMIDPRGIVLTNAHVAQYVLLSESQQVDLDCSIRTGSPASPTWHAQVIYMPSVWVNSHYQDINADEVEGTGEHDYALLAITSDMQGNPVTGALPYLPVDSRADVVNTGDSVLGAGYPAEFVGGIVAQQGLYAVSSVTTIKDVFTFASSTIDVYSIGGVIEAQGGSSGGPVINAWGHVIAIISTTSEGATTAERDLHAVALNYIDRDILLQTGHPLASFLATDPIQQANDFSRETAPALVQKYIDYLSR